MKHLFLIFLFVSSGMLAQNDKHEKIRALKRAHITEALNLTPEEAERFWPIYNAYEEQMHTLRRKERKHMAKPNEESMNALTDKEANAMIDTMLDYKTRELEQQKKLVEDLRKILPASKILRLHKAEEDFKRMLLKRYKEHRGNHPLP